MGEKLAEVVLVEEPKTFDSEQEELLAAEKRKGELFVLFFLSERIAKFSIGVREQMMRKKSRKGLKYSKGEMATLAISIE